MGIRIATAALSRRIFAGHLNKAGTGFREPRHDVTSDVLAAVVDHIGVGNERVIAENGQPRYRIAISEISP